MHTLEMAICKVEMGVFVIFVFVIKPIISFVAFKKARFVTHPVLTLKIIIMTNRRIIIMTNRK